MTKSKRKNNFSISLKRLEEIKRATLIASAGASVRLAGSKVTNEQVEKIMNAFSKSSEQK